jgi:hypothetical protein
VVGIFPRFSGIKCSFLKPSIAFYSAYCS